MKGKIMTNDKTKNAAATDGPYEVIYFAKKHRISNEDARNIIEKYGANRKEADKAGRRISA
jgi:phage-related protein